MLFGYSLLVDGYLVNQIWKKSVLVIKEHTEMKVYTGKAMHFVNPTYPFN